MNDAPELTSLRVGDVGPRKDGISKRRSSVLVSLILSVEMALMLHVELQDHDNSARMFCSRFNWI